MKVLTIKQPWATLIVDGVKDVENRMWKLPAKYVGQRILIHAGKDDSFYKQQMETVFSMDQLIHISNRYNGTHLSNADFQLGAIIGSVEITGCVTDSDSVWAMPDHFHFTLAHAVRFPQQIPENGKLGFWEYEQIKAEPEEAGGALFCHCQLAVKDEVQLYRDGNLVRCHYCGGIWYR